MSREEKLAYAAFMVESGGSQPGPLLFQTSLWRDRVEHYRKVLFIFDGLVENTP